MRLVWVSLAAAAVAASSGCRLFDRWSKDRDRTPADLSGRTRDSDPNKPPKNYLDNPAPTNRNAGVPTAGTGANPQDRPFDVKAEFQRMIAGVVVDTDGTPVPNLDVAYELADQPGVGGVPVQTDKNGIFLIRGLKANAGYTLTARASRGGKPLAAQSAARTPSPHVRLQLRDDITLPPAPAARPAGDLPPATSVFDPPRPNPTTELDAPRPNTDGGGYSPNPPAKPAPPPVTVKPDLVAPGPPTLDKPPVANIPGPGALLPPPKIPPGN